jgi:hypothetical protein
MLTCGSDIAVQEIHESWGCPYQRMPSLAIWEAQEAMEKRVSVRENGYPNFLA